MVFAEKSENGVTLVTIQGAQTLDLVIAVLGELKDVSALATTQYPEVRFGDDAAPQFRSTPDHLFAHSCLRDGNAVAVEVAGGRPAETVSFHLEVTGDKGDLTLSGGAIRGFQSGRLNLSLKGKPEQVDEGEVRTMPDEAANAAGMYVSLKDDIGSGTWTVPDFEHAVRLTCLMDDVISSSQSGVRKQAADWPSQQ